MFVVARFLLKRKKYGYPYFLNQVAKNLFAEKEILPFWGSVTQHFKNVLRNLLLTDLSIDCWLIWFWLLTCMRVDKLTLYISPGTF